MEVSELIKKGAHEVRSNPDLMALYLTEYEKRFGKKPNCAGCTFKNDWKRFVNPFKVSAQSQPINQIQMADKTFKLKKVENKILSYWESGYPHRKYDNKLTEEFAIAYLTHGTPEQLEARRKEFAILPESLTKVEEPKAEVEPTKEEKPKKTRTSKPKK